MSFTVPAHDDIQNIPTIPGNHHRPIVGGQYLHQLGTNRKHNVAIAEVAAEAVWAREPRHGGTV